MTGTDDSPNESPVALFDGDTDQPLFKFGDLETRSEALLHSLIVLLGTLVAANILVVVGVDILQSLGYTEETAPVTVYSLRMSFNFVGFLAVGLAYLAWREDSIVALSTPTRRDMLVIVGGFVVLAASMLLFEFFVDLLEVDTAENVAIERGRAHPELFLILLPIQFLLTAPAEELLFRGVIQGLLRRAYGVIPGILLAAGLFSLFHLPALLGSDGLVPVLLILFFSGVILGALYEYTGNLFVPIVCHALWNFVVFSTVYLETILTFGGNI